MHAQPLTCCRVLTEQTQQSPAVSSVSSVSQSGQAILKRDCTDACVSRCGYVVTRRAWGVLTAPCSIVALQVSWSQDRSEVLGETTGAEPSTRPLVSHAEDEDVCAVDGNTVRSDDDYQREIYRVADR
jgi:hypothetical protein